MGLGIESSRYQREKGVYSHFCGVNSYSSIEEHEGENVPVELHLGDRVKPMPLVGNCDPIGARFDPRLLLRREGVEICPICIDSIVDVEAGEKDS
jgi:hypothetical protein